MPILLFQAFGRIFFILRTDNFLMIFNAHFEAPSWHLDRFIWIIKMSKRLSFKIKIMEKHEIGMTGISDLVKAIQKANSFFLDQVQKQVNTSLTIRNWVIGYYLAEYEQNGQDRAEYGEKLYRKLSERLKKASIKGLSYSTLHLYKQFYNTYPQIVQSISEF